MRRFGEIHNIIINRLKEGLPSYLTYHDVAHTEDVIKKSILLAELANLTQDEIDLIKTAALYHDSGFLMAREEHEEKSCLIVENDRLEMDFSKSDLQKICEMIQATKIPQNATSLYQKILADADLFYLGTGEYALYANKLFEEIKYFTPQITTEEWFRIQIDFMEQHSYFTPYGKSVLDPVKQKNLKSLKDSACAN